jgi:hypothetical protein
MKDILLIIKLIIRITVEEEAIAIIIMELVIAKPLKTFIITLVK